MPANVQTFALRSDQYARHRPTYPPALFAYLAALTAAHDQAWDGATGTGQAALGCAEFFAHVTATDLSAEQIQQAPRHPRVTYAVGPAEQTTLAAGTVDLITVAQAVHWFDLPRFYAECRRVLKPGGVLAVWGYAFFAIEPALDAVIAEKFLPRLEPFWAAGNRILMDGYRALPFPFAEVPARPGFNILLDWNRTQLLDYLRTWSGVKRYLAEQGHDPVADLERELAPLWPEPATVKLVTMPLALKVGRHIPVPDA